jgi:dCMP deaminase
MPEIKEYFNDPSSIPPEFKVMDVDFSKVKERTKKDTPPENKRTDAWSRLKGLLGQSNTPDLFSIDTDTSKVDKTTTPVIARPLNPLPSLAEVLSKLRTPTKRSSVDHFYLMIALTASMRSTCLRRRFGAVLVPASGRGVEIAYVGAPSGVESCMEKKYCYREGHNVPNGEQYEKCFSVHAEMNVIINSSPEKLRGATLYIAAVEGRTGRLCNSNPCILCTRMIMNAGIETVVALQAGGQVSAYKVQEWKDNPEMLTKGLYGK